MTLARIIPFLLFTFLAIIPGVGWAEKAQPAATPEDALQLRPEFTLPDLQDTARAISEWDGKLIVLNFWATWCVPCKEEMPQFVTLQSRLEKQGVQFVGVALDDRTPVARFAELLSINYPLLLGGFDAIDIARAYGNDAGALPYTVIIDRNRKIRHTHLGAIDSGELTRLLEELL